MSGESLDYIAANSNNWRAAITEAEKAAEAEEAKRRAEERIEIRARFKIEGSKTYNNRPDFMLKNILCDGKITGVSAPENYEDAKTFYSSIESKLQGKELDIYMKRPDEEATQMQIVKGQFLEIDKAGNYVVIKGATKCYLRFAEASNAIVAIKDNAGTLLYLNSVAFEQSDVCQSIVNLSSMKNRGIFTSYLMPEKESKPDSKLESGDQKIVPAA
jgi:hypothetical protein